MTNLEALDELIALATNAGMLGGEAIAAGARAYGRRHRGLSDRWREASRQATEAEQALSAARAKFIANTGAGSRSAWNWEAEITEQSSPILRRPLDVGGSMERKLAIDVARRALKAVRNPIEDGPGAYPWAYFAEETRSWWGATSDAMVQLADMLANISTGDAHAPSTVIAAWSKADIHAVKLDRTLSRRLDIMMHDMVP